MTAAAVLFVLIGVLSALPLIFILWQAGISAAAIMKKPVSYPQLPPQKFAVIVCARNEERVIGALLDSLQGQTYPKEQYQVFVVAHNCSDKTAETAKMHGARVLVRDMPSEQQKSDALRFALHYLNENHGGEFDCFCVFDADCIASPDFLQELNRGFSQGADAVSGYYDSRNFGAGLISRMTGTLYHVVMHATCDAQNRLGLPVNIYGTGFAVKMKWSGEASRLQTMVEDFELSIRLVLKGARLAFAPSAVFYAEMPEALGVAAAQRRRWTYGDLQCFRLYGSQLLYAIPQRGLSAVKQLADTLMVPVCLLTAAGLLLGLLWALLQSRLKIFLLFLAAVLLLFQLILSLAAANALKSRQKPVLKSIGAILLTPLWVAFTLPLSVAALLFPLSAWKPVPHHSQNKINEMEH